MTGTLDNASSYLRSRKRLSSKSQGRKKKSEEFINDRSQGFLVSSKQIEETQTRNSEKSRAKVKARRRLQSGPRGNWIVFSTGWHIKINLVDSEAAADLLETASDELKKQEKLLSSGLTGTLTPGL